MLSCRMPCRLDHIGFIVSKVCGGCSSLFQFYCNELLDQRSLLSEARNESGVLKSFTTDSQQRTSVGSLAFQEKDRQCQESLEERLC